MTRDSIPPPPEAVLIRNALERTGMSAREAARRTGISDARWRQIIAGHQRVSGVQVPVTAPHDTIARMAWAVGVTPEELRKAGRPEAADLLAERGGPPSLASKADAWAGPMQVDAIATLLASLPPEAQDEVLRRIGRGGTLTPGEEQENWRRQAS